MVLYSVQVGNYPSFIVNPEAVDSFKNPFTGEVERRSVLLATQQQVKFLTDSELESMRITPIVCQ